MKTIALALIFKDEIPELKAVYEKNKDIFDKFYFTNANSGKDAYNVAKKLFKDEPKVELNHFEWVKDFAKARNSNLKQVETDYWVWMDMDDQVDFSKIRDLVNKMDQQDLDMMYFPYNYAQDEYGDSIAMHWRERLIRTDHPFEWKGAVHETLISPEAPNQAKNSEIVWVHHNPPAKLKQSMGRNLEILENEYEKGDPRIAHYLGISYFTLERYEDAIKLFREHIEKSGWNEESYRSQLKISEAYAMLDKTEDAINEALFATKINDMEEYPDAYLLLARYYFDLEEYKKCLTWLKVANLMPVPETFSIIDPTQYGYRSTMLAAMANLKLGRFETAVPLFREVLKANPEYEHAKTLMGLGLQELQAKKATDSIKDLALYLKDDKKALKRLYEALPSGLRYDARVAPLRNMVKDPVEWGDKSIVFFCGNTFETWGPDTMEKGMGGSEEAVVNLARQFRDMGYEVTVYNTRDTVYEDRLPYTKDKNGNDVFSKPIRYLPWYHVDYKDTFNILVCWRAPELAKHMKAKLKLLDVHDVLTPQRLSDNQQYYDKIMVKTNYHRSLYPDVPDEKFVVIGNGIDRSHFEKKKKKPFTAGYFSAPDRGLLTLLQMWPKIKERVPEAKLVWNYGWESYTNAMGKDWLYNEITKLFKELEPLDVVDGGRISHQELADVMAETKVWLYPTEFPEIFCITAVKVEEAGMIPVTTGYAALAETQTQGHKIPFDKIYTEEDAQEAFIEAAVEALTSDEETEPQENADWKDKAKQWQKTFTKNAT